MRSLISNPNIDNSDPSNYPPGRIKNDTGSGDGTPVDERVYGDMHQAWAKLMRLYSITPNGFPDNETTGFQLVDALRALASKNDFILKLTSVSGVLSVPVKIGSMLENEHLDCKAAFDVDDETTIKGSDNVVLTFTKIGDFKTDEYVRLVKTASAILLIRLVDLVNLNLAVSELLYLKKASVPQEMAGVLDTVATTPLSNLLAFVERVNGTASDDALAIPSVRNGLLSKEFAQIIADIGAPAERNYGGIAGYNPNSLPVGTSLPVFGDITSAVYTENVNNGDIITCTMANSMDNIDYEVWPNVQSLGNMDNDNSIEPVLWSIVSVTQFKIIVGTTLSNSKNLKIHLTVKQR